MTLRDFQQSLAEKVHRAGEGGAPQALLGFESGSEYWLVDLADAGEVLPVPALSEVPLTRPWFLGIANIRGTLYSVSDLAGFHGETATRGGAEERLLLAGPRFGSNTALLMSRTLGLKPLARLESLATDVAATQAWRGERYRDSEGRIWTRLLLPLLLQATQFLEIAA